MTQFYLHVFTTDFVDNVFVNFRINRFTVMARAQVEVCTVEYRHRLQRDAAAPGHGTVDLETRHNRDQNRTPMSTRNHAL